MLCKLYSGKPEVLVVQWIERLTSDPDIAGSNPAEDYFGFRCFSLFQKFTCIKNCLCFTQKKIRMSDEEISSSERPKIYATKKSRDNCSWKENTKPETETATFFRSTKLCADGKLFWTFEDTNLKVENHKTNFDRLEHSAISERLHFYLRGCNIGSNRWRRGILKFYLFRSKTSFSSKLFVPHN